MKVYILLIFTLIIGTSCDSTSNKKYAYVLNQKIFDEFDGTKEVKIKLTKLQEKQNSILDSINLSILSVEKSKDSNRETKIAQSKTLYNKLYSEFSLDQQKQLQVYSDEIWKQINQYLSDYGKQEKYDIIFGANGTGTIMYANTTLDISDKVLQYINDRYAGK